jgi:hypothetical protein
MKKVYVYKPHVSRYYTLKDGVDVEEYRRSHPDYIVTTKKPPSEGVLMRWDYNGVAKTPCGCKVEPDGKCYHGYFSHLIYRGLI